MQGFEIIFYTKADGTAPVNDFLYKLSKKMHAKALKELGALSQYGNQLREPYTKYIGDGLFELRIKVGTDISRILYFYSKEKMIVLTNGFIKKTDRTPWSEILKAKRYRNDFWKRGEGI